MVSVDLVQVVVVVVVTVDSNAAAENGDSKFSFSGSKRGDSATGMRRWRHFGDGMSMSVAGSAGLARVARMCAEIGDLLAL